MCLSVTTAEDGDVNSNSYALIAEKRRNLKRAVHPRGRSLLSQRSEKRLITVRGELEDVRKFFKNFKIYDDISHAKCFNG